MPAPPPPPRPHSTNFQPALPAPSPSSSPRRIPPRISPPTQRRDATPEPPTPAASSATYSSSASTSAGAPTRPSNSTTWPAISTTPKPAPISADSPFGCYRKGMALAPGEGVQRDIGAALQNLDKDCSFWKAGFICRDAREVRTQSKLPDGPEWKALPKGSTALAQFMARDCDSGGPASRDALAGF